jgi:hypothetical protein
MQPRIGRPFGASNVHSMDPSAAVKGHEGENCHFLPAADTCARDRECLAEGGTRWQCGAAIESGRSDLTFPQTIAAPWYERCSDPSSVADRAGASLSDASAFAMYEGNRFDTARPPVELTRATLPMRRTAAVPVLLLGSARRLARGALSGRPLRPPLIGASKSADGLIRPAAPTWAPKSQSGKLLSPM